MQAVKLNSVIVHYEMPSIRIFFMLVTACVCYYLLLFMFAPFSAH